LIVNVFNGKDTGGQLSLCTQFFAPQKQGNLSGSYANL